MKKKKSYEIITTAVLAVVFLFASAGLIAATCFNDTEYTVTVTDKERVVSRSGDNVNSKYLIFCEDENEDTYVFENTDNLFRGKLNSSDYQGKLKVGKTYRLTVVGYRIPLVSAYQNIIKVEETERE